MSTECIASPVPRIAHHTASWQGTAQESQVVGGPMMVPFVEGAHTRDDPRIAFDQRKHIPCCSHSLYVPLRAGSAGHVHLR